MADKESCGLFDEYVEMKEIYLPEDLSDSLIFLSFVNIYEGDRVFSTC